jgi:2-iminobutanoate/2-iminopropanoate deaminase
MAKQRIHTEKAPQPVGPYSQAVAVDGWVYVAGQVPIDPATGNWLKGDIVVQTERVLRNVQAILEAAGGGLQDVVKTTVYMADLGEFAAMNEVYARYFNDACPPARATIEAKNLPGGVRLEMEAIARVGAGKSSGNV